VEVPKNKIKFDKATLEAFYSVFIVLKAEVVLAEFVSHEGGVNELMLKSSVHFLVSAPQPPGLKTTLYPSQSILLLIIITF
jgi:hypothetical protein